MILLQRQVNSPMMAQQGLAIILHSFLHFDPSGMRRMCILLAHALKSNCLKSISLVIYFSIHWYTISDACKTETKLIRLTTTNVGRRTYFLSNDNVRLIVWLVFRQKSAKISSLPSGPTYNLPKSAILDVQIRI